MRIRMIKKGLSIELGTFNESTEVDVFEYFLVRILSKKYELKFDYV